MRRYFTVQVSFELKWELHEYFRVVCCDFCYSRLSQFLCLFVCLFVCLRLWVPAVLYSSCVCVCVSDALFVLLVAFWPLFVFLGCSLPSSVGLVFRVRSWLFVCLLACLRACWLACSFLFLNLAGEGGWVLVLVLLALALVLALVLVLVLVLLAL